MVKFTDVFLFVFFTAFLVFWGTEVFTNTGDISYHIYVSIMFFSHMGVSSLYLYKILKGLKGEDV